MNEKSRLIFRLALSNQAIKKITWANDNVIRKSVSYHTKSFTDKVSSKLKAKSRVIHIRISIPKQYQMMMSPAARVKFNKTKVIFRYHTKGVSNQVSSNSDHEIKSY